MTKIITLIILTFSFYSNLLAENDINKLSKEDREQCEKIIEIKNEYYDYFLTSKENQLKLQKKNYEIYEIILYKINPYLFITEDGQYVKNIKYNFDWVDEKKTIHETSTANLIMKDNKIIGITPIFHRDYSGHGYGSYEYIKGYLFDTMDYMSLRNLKKEDSYLNKWINGKHVGEYLTNPLYDYDKKKLHSVIILPENFDKHQLDLRINKFKQSYIKIRYCFVEKYRN